MEMEARKPQPRSEYPSPSPLSSSSSSSSSKESLIKRYKPIWRILLISNLALGAYMFAQASKKHLRLEHRKGSKKGIEEGKASLEDPLENITTSPAPKGLLSAPAALKSKEPIPEDQQRELFRWILEEKRKLKPKDPEEKKRIDEEKAILKKSIRAKSIPSI